MDRNANSPFPLPRLPAGRGERLAPLALVRETVPGACVPAEIGSRLPMLAGSATPLQATRSAFKVLGKGNADSRSGRVKVTLTLHHAERPAAALICWHFRFSVSLRRNAEAIVGVGRGELVATQYTPHSAVT